jgi:hypothetical protein
LWYNSVTLFYLVSWSGYCNAYLNSGIAKTRGLFHAKISRQRLQGMLVSYDPDAERNGMNDIFIMNYRIIHYECKGNYCRDFRSSSSRYHGTFSYSFMIIGVLKFTSKTTKYEEL